MTTNSTDYWQNSRKHRQKLKVNDIPFTEQNAITCEEIKQHIKKILKGKVPGLDFLTIEHLIHSDYTLIE